MNTGTARSVPRAALAFPCTDDSISRRLIAASPLRLRVESIQIERSAAIILDYRVQINRGRCERRSNVRFNHRSSIFAAVARSSLSLRRKILSRFMATIVKDISFYLLYTLEGIKMEMKKKVCTDYWPPFSPLLPKSRD